MKKIYFLMVLFWATQSYGQKLGVNTKEVNSTLTVNGSLAVKYLEVKTSTYQLLDEDFNVAFSGGNATEGEITLPKIDEDVVSGRIYQIKNLSADKNLKVKAASGQKIRFGGTLKDSEEVLLSPGRYVSIIANNNKGTALWDLNIFGMNEEVVFPEIKTLEYVRKSVVYNAAAVATIERDSEVSIGNISVRYNISTPNPKGLVGYVEFKIKGGGNATVWFQKASAVNSSVSASCYFQARLLNGTWSAFCNRIETDRQTVGDRDVSVAYVTINTTHENYRITTSINSGIPTFNGVPGAASNITLFIEKLD